MATLSKDIIEAAIEGLESRRIKIDEMIAELREQLTGTHAGSQAGAKPGKRKFSPATIQKMREAQKRRWASLKKETSSSTDAPKPKSKRKLSPAGRKAIVEALKKRWAAKRAAA